MTVHAEPYEALMCLMLIAFGIPVYLIFVKMDKPKSLDNAISNQFYYFSILFPSKRFLFIFIL